MTMGNKHTFGDVAPIKNGDFPGSHLCLLQARSARSLTARSSVGGELSRG